MNTFLSNVWLTKLYRALVVIVGLLSVAAIGHAATMIAEKEVGTIQGANTIDTLGFFGTAGANLAGKTVTVYSQYVVDDFGPVTECRTHACTLATAQNTPGATVIAVYINGKEIVYTSKHFAQVLFDNNSPQNYFYIYANTGDFGLGYNGIRVATSYTAPVTFGSVLSPVNPPVFGVDLNSIEIFTTENELPSETLNFLLTSAVQ